MRYFNMIFLLWLVLVSCCGNADTTDKTNILTDIVTLELSFGSEDLPDEYLLVLNDPISPLVVNDSGDIMVLDELRLKVFDKNGEPKTIIGRPGEGPGEFSGWIMGMWLSPTGYLTVEDNSMNYSLFTPDNKFVEKDNFRFGEIPKKLLEEHGIKVRFPEKIVTLRKSNRVIQVIQGGLVLAYENDGKVSVLARYKSGNTAKFWGEGFMLYAGTFQWEVLPGNRVVYAHSGQDRVIEEVSGTYTLHIVSLETLETQELTLPFSLTVIPDSIIANIRHKPTLRAVGGAPPNYKKGKKEQQNLVRKVKYYPPFYRMMADGSVIFLFTGVERYQGENFAYVVDLSTGKHLSTVRFPFLPLYIKDGYVYIFKVGPDIFPEIEKYKINPAMYGK